MQPKHFAAPASFKAADVAKGLFEAIVSVFGNVDHVGDRVVKGAFQKSIATWKNSGRSIPIIFSHQWGNLDAHIGKVLEAQERDAGLWVKGQIRMDDPPARKVFELMRDGTLSEFSFAYNTVRERQKDGANELLELEIIEVGPTLKGANPATQLLDIKASGYGYGASAEAERFSAELLAMSFAAGLGRSPKAARAAIAELEHVPTGYKGSGKTLAARVAIELAELEVSAMAAPKSLRRKSADGPPPGYVRIVNACKTAGKTDALIESACRIAAYGLAQQYAQQYALNRDQCDRLADGVLKGRGSAIKRQALEHGDAMLVTLDPHPPVYVAMLGGYV
jgi:HK97 family phage prohead protease